MIRAWDARMTRCGAVLCCAVPRCAVLCCAVLRCAALCRAAPNHPPGAGAGDCVGLGQHRRRDDIEPRQQDTNRRLPQRRQGHVPTGLTGQLQGTLGQRQQGEPVQRSLKVNPRSQILLLAKHAHCRVFIWTLDSFHWRPTTARCQAVPTAKAKLLLLLLLLHRIKLTPTCSSARLQQTPRACATSPSQRSPCLLTQRVCPGENRKLEA